MTDADSPQPPATSAGRSPSAALLGVISIAVVGSDDGRIWEADVIRVYFAAS